jgi:hypothetical protein
MNVRSLTNGREASCDGKHAVRQSGLKRKPGFERATGPDPTCPELHMTATGRKKPRNLIEPNVTEHEETLTARTRQKPRNRHLPKMAQYVC